MSLMSIDVKEIRKDFPILNLFTKGKKLVYLDSAATSQKPQVVINAISDFYMKYNANIHRGVYEISEKATLAYEDSKIKVGKFINAKSYREIIYLRNATEAINIIALGFGEKIIKKGDRILITEMEHHSNIVPWQMLAKRKGAILDYVKLDKELAYLDMEDLKAKLNKKPKIVAFTHSSNVIGTINKVKEITKISHEAGSKVVLDVAQSAPHMKIDVKDIDCDFAAFSGHKMLAPSGIGVLYGKEEILDNTEPVFGGGDMIKNVDFQESIWNDLPWKMEAGTANIEGGIALGVAVDYLSKIGMENIRKHDIELTKYAMEKLLEINGLKIYGPNIDKVKDRGSVISFSLEGIHPHDLATLLDNEGIAIRAGHHCAIPLVRNRIEQPALSRVSFYIYNTFEEIDLLISGINKARKVFNK